MNYNVIQDRNDLPESFRPLFDLAVENPEAELDANMPKGFTEISGDPGGISWLNAAERVEVRYEYDYAWIVMTDLDDETIANFRASRFYVRNLLDSL